jgi:hypothetical protein
MTKPKSFFRHGASVGLQTGSAFVPMSDVCVKYDRSPSTILRRIDDPESGFPRPVQMSPGGPLLFNIDELAAYDKRQAEIARVKWDERAAHLADKRAKQKAEADRIVEEAARAAASPVRRRKKLARPGVAL